MLAQSSINTGNMKYEEDKPIGKTSGVRIKISQ